MDSQNNSEKSYGRMYADKIRESLHQKINSYSRQLCGGIVSASFKDLKGRIADFDVNGNNIGWAASTIKVPVMIEVFNQAAKGIISLEERVEINHKHTLEKTDFISRLPANKKLDFWTLVYFMIVHSDNEATNILADRIGLENINNTCQELGAKHTMIGHLLLPKALRLISDFNPEGSNVTTSNDMNLLLSLIYRKEIANQEYCNEMINFLENTSQNFLGSYLPESTKIGNKVGYISDPAAGDDMHDVGVINRSYILSVMLNKVRSDEIKNDAGFGLSSRIILPWNINSIQLNQASQPPTKSILIEPEPRKPLAFTVFSKEEDDYIFPGAEFIIIGQLSKIVYNAYYKKALIKEGSQ
ncbi:serine hydrolase [Candidatus Woesearchaeota archaeon]|nr:serine hydrolase [Candidatus Woesearchaeota archaeon]